MPSELATLVGPDLRQIRKHLTLMHAAAYANDELQLVRETASLLVAAIGLSANLTGFSLTEVTTTLADKIRSCDPSTH